MLRWLTRLCEAFQEPPAPEDPERLRAEIQRLGELAQAYREFGFDDLASDCSRQKTELQGALKRLKKAGAA